MSDIVEARKRWEKANTVGATGDDIRESWMDVPILIKEVERLRAIVDRLPVTADGVRVMLGDDVYSPSGRRHAVRVATTIRPEQDDYYIPESTNTNGEWSDIRVFACYSTRAAAEAAAKENSK